MESGKVRPLQTADVDDIFSLLTVVYTSPRHPLGGSWNKRLVETELDRGAGLGLSVGGKLAAFVLYRFLDEAWEVSILATHPEAQRRGHMERLIGELVKSCPSEKVIWLEAHEANDAANNLYRKLGFRQVGRRPRYYRDGAAAVLYSSR